MKRFITSLKNIWKVEELRKRILLTLGLILIYRIGSFIILPGVDYTALVAAQESGNRIHDSIDSHDALGRLYDSRRVTPVRSSLLP